MSNNFPNQSSRTAVSFIISLQLLRLAQDLFKCQNKSYSVDAETTLTIKKKRKSPSFFSFFAFLVDNQICTSCKDFEKENKQLMTRITELEKKQTLEKQTLEKQLQNIKEEKTTLFQENEQNKSRIKTLEKDLKENQTQKKELQDENKTLLQDVDNEKKKVNSVVGLFCRGISSLTFKKMHRCHKQVSLKTGSNFIFNFNVFLLKPL